MPKMTYFDVFSSILPAGPDDVINFADVSIFAGPVSIFTLKNPLLAKKCVEFEPQVGLGWLIPHFVAIELY